jgi:hypothetical protein
LEILSVLAADGVGSNPPGGLLLTARVVGHGFGATDDDIAEARDHLCGRGLVRRAGEAGGVTPLGRMVAGRLGPRRPLLLHRPWLPH